MDKLTKEYIHNKLSLVPTLPGSYQMKNADGVIIYVGKAKNLKRRLTSYFNREQEGKTKMLVDDIKDFDYIVTSSELESLILEITLIKKYDPKYNILLRDDKSYPYIELTKEDYPRVRVIRNINRKKKTSTMFGPYPDAYSARKTCEIINRIYPLRKCDKLKKELCLYYHLGECLGYCVNKIPKEEIESMESEIVSFLKGDASIITNKIKSKMEEASNNLNYELALEYKEMLESINKTLIHQKLDLNRKYNFDVLGYYEEAGFISIELFFIREGLLFGKHSEIINLVSETKDDLEEFLIKFYENNPMPKELMVPDIIDTELLSNYFNINVSTKSKGDIKKLVNLASENASINLNNRLEELKRSNNSREKALLDLKTILGTNNISRIESFDNSHLFGTFYVSGMVTYDDFIPNKNLYRKFKINSGVKDDLGAMKEVLLRRYYHVMMEEDKAPDLIVLDGGETQVSICNEVLNKLNLDINVIGLKKDDKHRTKDIILKDLSTVSLKEYPELYIYLGRIQEEVHRFAISYHRSIRSKGALTSVLDLAPGIGEASSKKLINKFGSLKRIKEAEIDELEEVLNKSQAEKLYNYLKEID